MAPAVGYRERRAAVPAHGRYPSSHRACRHRATGLGEEVGAPQSGRDWNHEVKCGQPVVWLAISTIRTRGHQLRDPRTDVLLRASTVIDSMARAHGVAIRGAWSPPVAYAVNSKPLGLCSTSTASASSPATLYLPGVGRR